MAGTIRGRAYDKIYLDDFAFSVATLFERVATKNVDCIGTINVLLRSRAFADITERANPRYLNMGSWQLLDCVECDEGFDWKHSKRTKKYDPNIMWWVGRLLETFRWSYKIDFRDWLKYETVENIYGLYYPLHEASFETAACKLMNRYLRRKAETMTGAEKETHINGIRQIIKTYPELREEISWIN